LDTALRRNVPPAFPRGSAQCRALARDCAEGRSCKAEEAAVLISLRAVPNTDRIIRAVSLPVLVFCRLGW
jgi:hypothetical protein